MENIGSLAIEVVELGHSLLSSICLFLVEMDVQYFGLLILFMWVIAYFHVGIPQSLFPSVIYLEKQKIVKLPACVLFVNKNKPLL